MIARLKVGYPEFTLDFGQLPSVFQKMAEEKLVEDIKNQVRDLNSNELMMLAKSFTEFSSNGKKEDSKKKKVKDEKEFH
jgi:hypothetical protein